MIFAHFSCLILKIYKKKLKASHQNGINAYIKSVLTMVSISIYMASYLFVQYKRDKAMTNMDEIIGKMSETNLFYFEAINLFRVLEIWVFYAQVLSIFIYVLQCSLFFYFKKKFCSDYQQLNDDPFCKSLIN